MQNSEYEDILASVQKLVRQAYDLGRADALKQVVEVLKEGPVPPKPLAIAGPAPDAAPGLKAEPGHEPTPAELRASPAKAEPDASFDVMSTPAKTPDAPAREEKASKPWWSR